MCPLVGILTVPQEGTDSLIQKELVIKGKL
jgi:hypothetical protein